ncbi:MAG: efflux RND transporter permease subunit [Deltaproteobacteria bacterium]|nr:efflux RND transporter permease subunit [Deltaproteobacteria bacterium]
MLISDTSIRRPVMTLTIMAAILIFGWIAYKSMGIDLFPEIDFPVVTVQTVLEGASPEVIDADVTDVLEEQIKTIGGIKFLMSQSYESLSIIAVEFELEKDVDVAAQEVRAKVNLAERDLPDDVEKPVVDKMDTASNAVMWITVYGSADYGEMSYYADKVLKEQLQSISGVGNIQLGGLREREIRVWLNPEKLKARGLTAQDVVAAIKSKHLEMPGGRIETKEKEYSVKVKGEFTSVEELKNLVVAERDGTTISLKELGKVDDGFEDLRNIARFNGLPAIGLGIRKQSGTNTTEVIDAVKAKLEKIKKDAPEGISIGIALDTSGFIKESMEGVRFDIIFGVILTALIMYLFLRNIRVTFISVTAIPISLIGGFVLMNALGFTVNNLTMLAMSLSVGMVIDDAIVVMENIFRHVEAGEDPMNAASVGTGEVGLAVIAATSSVAAVFIPVAFMKGLIGRFFYQFGMTVALTIIISVLVSLTLTPLLCSRMLHHQRSHKKLYIILENAFLAVERGYRRALEWAVTYRWTVILIAVTTFVIGIYLVRFIGTEFVAQADSAQFKIGFELPTGTSIEETAKRLYELETIVAAQPETKQYFGAIGVGGGSEVNKGVMIVNLLPKGERKESQREIMRRMRTKLDAYKDMISSVEYLEQIGGGRRYADVDLVIKGPSVEELARVSEQIVADLRSQDIFVGVDTDLRITKPDVKVHINRDLADDLGVDVKSISDEIYILFGGTDAAKFKEGGYRYDIRVKALPEFRTDPSGLEIISVRARDGRLIEASNLITQEVSMGPNVINRFDRMRSLTLYADVEKISVGEGLVKAEEIIGKYLPKDGNWDTALVGKTQVFKESFQYLFQALLIAVLVIYMILCIQFESFVHPFTMMLALPLCMVGVFGALLLTGKTLNIFSFIGIIMLMGIVTKNGILLVDFANQQRRKGMDKVQAMLTAGPIRLRPILMTASAVIIGVVPVALALSEGGETRAPMAIAVIGGMISSTLLTLLVVPVVYLMLDDAQEWVSGKFWKHRRRVPINAVSEKKQGE